MWKLIEAGILIKKFYIEGVTKDAYANIEDKDLLEKFYSSGHNRWLGALLERYTMLLFGVCMKYFKDEEEARDAVQQIFLKVITGLPKYKVEYFKSWVYMIAKNHCLMKIRDRQGYRLQEMIDSYIVDDSEQKAELLQKDTILNLVEEGLAQLAEEQKQCVTLFYLQKKSYRQIADLTGYDLLQVKSYIQNGKRNLKQIVERKMNAVR